MPAALEEEKRRQWAKNNPLAGSPAAQVVGNNGARAEVKAAPGSRLAPYFDLHSRVQRAMRPASSRACV